jgi:hypothetical protein
MRTHIDNETMELAESVGLIGPASRTHDLHAAIQRFHDLICANATVKAAQMAAEVIRATTPLAAKPMAFAGLSLTEIKLPEGMTARFERGALIIERTEGKT